MLRIYTSATCAHCVFAKSFMARQGIPFMEVPVDQDEDAALEMVRLSGQTGLPVITDGESILVGFNPQGISQMAENT